MKLLQVLTLAGAVLLSACAPSNAAMRILFDPGGVITEYVDKYNAIHASGGSVVIDGPCISACTMIVGLVDREKVCVTKRAMLAFHSASEVTPFARKHSEDGTALLWNVYPDDVQDLLRKKGWDGGEHPNLIFIRGAELRSIYKECKA